MNGYFTRVFREILALGLPASINCEGRLTVYCRCKQKCAEPNRRLATMTEAAWSPAKARVLSCACMVKQPIEPKS